VGICFLLLPFLAHTQSTSDAKPMRMKLGAYYFGGWGGKNIKDDGTPANAWAAGLPTHVSERMYNEFSGRKPIWGWRDDDSSIMKQQIDLASKNGLSYFAFCWFWSKDKGAMNEAQIKANTRNAPMYQFMKASNNNKMQYCLMIANHKGAEIIGTEAWKAAADFWIKEYFKHPRYLTLNGKPVVMIFLPGETTPEALDYLQQAAKAAGLPGVEIVGLGVGKAKKENGYTLSSIYNTNPGYNKPSEEHSYTELVKAHQDRWYDPHPLPYIPVATAGWDRRPWEGPQGLFGVGVTELSWYFTGKTPQLFEAHLDAMAKWIETHPDQVTSDRLALVYAWNEMGEGSWLAPTVEDPKGAYLKAIKKVVYGK
jgi:hypothetical protein